MKRTDFNKKENTELVRLLAEEQAQKRKLIFKVGEGQLKDVRSLRASKKAIARIQTALKANKTA